MNECKDGRCCMLRDERALLAVGSRVDDRLTVRDEADAIIRRVEIFLLGPGCIPDGNAGEVIDEL